MAVRRIIAVARGLSPTVVSERKSGSEEQKKAATKLLKREVVKNFIVTAADLRKTPKLLKYIFSVQSASLAKKQ